MSEEQLKKLNERLAKAEELLDKALPLLNKSDLFIQDRIDWKVNYLLYLKDYKKK